MLGCQVARVISHEFRWWSNGGRPSILMLNIVGSNFQSSRWESLGRWPNFSSMRGEESFEIREWKLTTFAITLTLRIFCSWWIVLLLHEFNDSKFPKMDTHIEMSAWFLRSRIFTHRKYKSNNNIPSENGQHRSIPNTLKFQSRTADFSSLGFVNLKSPDPRCLFHS